MLVFEIVIALLLGGALLSMVSRRIGAPYPAIVALAGAGLALMPGTPGLSLAPELALTLFVAPVLLDAAFDSSLRDLRANWKTITSLALGAVVLTVAAVAFVARLLVPDMPWAVAIALGAIVAPPDAAAATAVLKQLKPPHRLMVILEGESLFNDASALLIYRLAVGVAVSGSLTVSSAVPTLLFVTFGSLALGYALSFVMLAWTKRIDDVAVAVVVQFCGAFGVWVLAERLHLSGILTIVVFAMAVSRRAAEATPARMRVPSFAVWEFAAFVLNVLAFILVGFQLKTILDRTPMTTVVTWLGIAGAVTVTTILARIVYVMAATWLRGAKSATTPKESLVASWAGMRGIVTLAAALALPEEGFPYRDLIIFLAFAVVLGTLVLQGITLKPLIRRMQLKDDGEVEREVQHARVETLRAAVSALSALPVSDVSDALQRRYSVQLKRAETESAEITDEVRQQQADEDAKIVNVATSAERQKLLTMRADGTIGDAAFQRVEQELDFEEISLQSIGS
ncbi:MAG: Na+/H+ antiporter [Archangium sp.]